MKRPICSSPTRVIKRRAQPKTRRADGDVGRAAADRFGEGRDVFEARADLLAIEVDRGTADGYDVERAAFALGAAMATSSSKRPWAPPRRPILSRLNSTMKHKFHLTVNVEYLFYL